MFAKCPHCGASILDDTEELCPSCDQPLKGPAKAAKKPAATAKKPTKAAAKKPDTEEPPAEPEPPRKATRKVVSAKDVSADDDPFDIGGAAGKQALRVQPKPSKGRMHRVECPMCESPGFVPKSAAGTEVRCWNKSCTLPLFKVPEIEKPPEPEPEPKKKPVAAIALLLILLAGGGAAAFVFMQPPAEEKRIQPIAAPETPEGTDGDNEPTGSGLIVRTEDKGPEVKTLAQVVTDGLDRLERQINDPKNGARDDSIRLAAEALLLHDRDSEAAKLLGRLPSRVTFYRIRPLVVQANQSLDNKDIASAEEAVTEALKLADRLPPTGREALDFATDLAVVLCRLGRMDEAENLIDNHHDSGPRGEYSALLAGARYSGTYDLSDIGSATLLRDTPNPQWVAVTRALVSSGERELALEWARRGTGSVGEDSLVAWAGTLSGDERLSVATVSNMASSDALAARLLAAAGLEAFSQVEQPEGDAAEAAIPAAVTELLNAAIAKLPPADVAAMPTPTLEEIYKSANARNAGLPEQSEVRAAALAFEKVAALQFVTGDSEAGWSTIKNGLESLRSQTPSPSELRELQEEYDSRSNAIRGNLENILGTTNRARLTQALAKYRRQVDKMVEATENRFALQERLSGIAIAAGAEEELLDWIQSSAELEPWWASSTAATLVASEDPSVASAAKSNAERNLPSESQSWGRVVRDGIAAGKTIDVARKLSSLKTEPYVRGQYAGLAASLIVKKGEFDEMRTLIKFLANHPVTRRDAIELAAAQAAVSGAGVAFAENLADRSAELEPQELVGLYAGTAIGAAGLPEPEPTPATDEADSTAE